MAYSSIEIRLGGLSVNTSTELTYPDGLDDLCARTLSLFKEGLITAKENGIDITVMTILSDYGDDSEDE